MGRYNWGDTLSSRAALVSRDARAALVKDPNQCAQAPKCPITDHTPAGRRWLCVLVSVACPIGSPVGPAGDPCPPLCAETCARPLLCTSLDRCCCRACLHLRHFWHHHRIGLRNRRFQVRILVPAFWCAQGRSEPEKLSWIPSGFPFTVSSSRLTSPNSLVTRLISIVKEPCILDRLSSILPKTE